MNGGSGVSMGGVRILREPQLFKCKLAFSFRDPVLFHTFSARV